MRNHKYKPLPDYLYIDVSEIHGQGVFTSAELEAGLLLGMTHMKNDFTCNNECFFDNGLIRTPLGGHINDSEDPNCRLIKSVFNDSTVYFLTTIRCICPMEELTVDYNKTPCGVAYWR